MSGFFGGGGTTTRTELDPAARQILEQIVGDTNALKAQNPPFVAPLDTATIAGLQSLQDRPQSGFIGDAADQLSSTLSGSFFGQNPGVTGFNAGLQGVEDAITHAATRGVGDQFSLAGRTGSPAQGIALGKSIARELAPFRFGAFENQLGRQSSAFENERQRQVAGLSLAPTVESVQDSLSRRLLGVGDVIQNQNQNVLTEPLRSFEFFLNPLLSAAGGFPRDTFTQDRASGSEIFSGIGNILLGLPKLFCSREFKENFEKVGPVLERLKALGVEKYNYKPEMNLGDGKHISPMAEDFAELFVGDGKTISIATFLGVLLKANQEILERLEAVEARL